MPNDNRTSKRLRELKRILSMSAKVAHQQGMLALVTQIIEKMRRHELHIVPSSVPDTIYYQWIMTHEPSEAHLAEQRAKAKEMFWRPLLSIITPVWNPPPEVLVETLRSVLSQTYDNWELCVADGGSNYRVREVLEKAAATDARVRVRFLERNLGISRNSNAAVELANGEFVAFLDQDDLLSPAALFEVASCLQSEPNLDFIYSDMDRLDADGRRFDPLFKPDWSPDIMVCANYIVHLRVIRKTLLEEIGGFRAETDGAQDWDLILRMGERTDKIHHIPKVLYHWRQSPRSAATAGFRTKPVAAEAQLLSICQHLRRRGVMGESGFDDRDNLRIAWKIHPQPLVSIITHSDHLDDATKRCINSILTKSTYNHFEIFVVRGAEDTILATPDRRVTVLPYKGELTSAAARNYGADHSSGDVLVFLDHHVEVVSGDWLEELVGWAFQSTIGAVGSKLLSPNGKKIVHGGVVVGLSGFLFEGATERLWSPLGSTAWYRNLSAVSGSCIAVRRDVFLELGQFDDACGESYDIAFCLRARKRNYRIVYTPHAKLILHKDSNPGDRFHQLSRIPEYTELVQHGDPYFNANLSYDNPIPALNP